MNLNLCSFKIWVRTGIVQYIREATFHKKKTQKCQFIS